MYTLRKCTSPPRLIFLENVNGFNGSDSHATMIKILRKKVSHSWTLFSIRWWTTIRMSNFSNIICGQSFLPRLSVRSPFIRLFLERSSGVCIEGIPSVAYPVGNSKHSSPLLLFRCSKFHRLSIWKKWGGESFVYRDRGRVGSYRRYKSFHSDWSCVVTFRWVLYFSLFNSSESLLHYTNTAVLYLNTGPNTVLISVGKKSHQCRDIFFCFLFQGQYQKRWFQWKTT